MNHYYSCLAMPNRTKYFTIKQQEEKRTENKKLNNDAEITS